MTRVRQCLSGLVLVAAAACSQHSPASAPAGIDAAPAPAPAPLASSFTITAVDGLPAELVCELPVWEALYPPVGGRGPGGQRLYRDGQWYSYSPFRRTVVGGTERQVAAPLAWRFEARVSASGLVEIDRRVRERMAEMAARGAALRLDQAAIVYRAWVDDRAYVWSLPGRPDGESVSIPTLVTPIEAALHQGVLRDTIPVEQP